jgi:hypothetical protein
MTAGGAAVDGDDVSVAYQRLPWVCAFGTGARCLARTFRGGVGARAAGVLAGRLVRARYWIRASRICHPPPSCERLNTHSCVFVGRPTRDPIFGR